MSWFCRHEWDVVDKTVFKSTFETALSASPTSLNGMPAADAMLVLALACKKCGKLVIERHMQ